MKSIKPVYNIKSSLLYLMLCFPALPVLSQTNRPAIYPLNVRSAFIYGCVTSSQEAKLSQSHVRFCICMLDRVQNRFSLSQFVNMASGLDNNKKRENTLESFMEDNALECALGD